MRVQDAVGPRTAELGVTRAKVGAVWACAGASRLTMAKAVAMAVAMAATPAKTREIRPLGAEPVSIYMRCISPYLPLESQPTNKRCKGGPATRDLV